MDLLAVRVPGVAGITVALVATLAVGVASAGSPAKTNCPSPSLVRAALGLKLKASTSQTSPYAKVCIYKGGSIVPTKIQFQVDTASTFAAGEKAAAAYGTVIKVSGLGRSACGTKTGGFLAVFLGNESIRITAP
jgi:hypothetical protein